MITRSQQHHLVAQYIYLSLTFLSIMFIKDITRSSSDRESIPLTAKSSFWKKL